MKNGEQMHVLVSLIKLIFDQLVIDLFIYLKPRDATLLPDNFFLKSRPIHVYNAR